MKQFRSSFVVWALMAGALAGLCACSQKPRGTRLLLIGIDGGDWKQIDPLLAAGQMPHLQALLDRGVRAPLRSMHPIISPVIWTTMATGVGPDKHGVLDFSVPDPTTLEPTVITSRQRVAKAFWNLLTEAKRTVGVVGWWASWPAEEVRGVMVSDRVFNHPFLPGDPAPKDATWPREFEREIQPLLVSYESVDHATARRFIDVDADTYARLGKLDFADPVSHVRQIYATMASVANVAERLLLREKPELLAVYFEGIDTAGHMYLRYAPPDYPGTTAAERASFGGAVTAFYRYQDELLGRLVAAAGPETRVLLVSDHGFLSGLERPIERAHTVDYATAALWHRMEGIFVLSGPGVAAGAMIPAPSVFDVCSTVLWLLDLPVAKDSLGKPILAALSNAPPPREIASYADPAWTAARQEALRQPGEVDPEMMEKLRSLGYIGGGESGASISLRGRLGLAEFFQFTGQRGRAVQELTDLVRLAPDFADGHYQLGLAALEAKEHVRAEASFRRTLDLSPTNVPAMQNLAFVLKQTARAPEALEWMRRAVVVEPLNPGPHVNLAMLLREAGETDAALRALAPVLERDPRNHPALVQRALSLHGSRRFAEATLAWQAVLESMPQDARARQLLEDARSARPLRQ